MSGRSITYSQGIALYMGAVLGSGILILPGYTADVAGPAAILSWVLLSLASIPLAYTFARLSLKYQNYGGMATIVGEAFGAKWRAIVGWFFFVWVATGQAVVGMTGAGYLKNELHLQPAWYYGIAELFLVAALATNLLGIRASGRLALALSGGVLLLLVLTIAFSLPKVEAARMTPFWPHGIGGAGRACVLIFWAFFGWESITHLVPEFRNPDRDVMRSTWSSVFLIGAVYTLLAIVTVGTGTYGPNASAAPLASLMSRAIGVSAGAATAAVACIVCVGTLNVYIASSSRLGYSLARDRQFPAWFGRLDKQGTPTRSAWFLFGTNTLMIALSAGFRLPVDELIKVPTSLGICVYLVGSAACLKLLWNDRRGRLAAGISSLSCLAVAPFATGYLVGPVIVTAACLLYLRLRAPAPIKINRN